VTSGVDHGKGERKERGKKDGRKERKKEEENKEKRRKKKPSLVTAKREIMGEKMMRIRRRGVEERNKKRE